MARIFTYLGNTVFVLNPRAEQPCHFALCEYIHETSAYPEYAHDITVEPLIDWITLEPALDITTIWFSLYRRNRKLLDKFSLSNSRFIPRNPLRLCFECLLYLANERNKVWRMRNRYHHILLSDTSNAWPRSTCVETVERKLNETEASSNVSYSASAYSSASEDPAERVTPCTAGQVVGRNLPLAVTVLM